MTAWLGGLVFGLVGSGHCAAMCGPLVLLASQRPTDSAGAVTPSAPRVAAHAALYHVGRAATYLTLGAAAGMAGTSLSRLGLGRALAIAAGTVLLAHALLATGAVSSRRRTGRGASAVTRTLASANVWMRRHRVQGPMVFGALNGLLPCGLVYAALVAATGLGDLRGSLTFMGAFALGTTPVLMLVGLAGGAFTSRVPIRVRRAAPVALALVGALLIARGLQPTHGTHATHAAHAHAR